MANLVEETQTKMKNLTHSDKGKKNEAPSLLKQLDISKTPNLIETEEFVGANEFELNDPQEEKKLNEPISYIFEEREFRGESGAEVNLEDVNKHYFADATPIFKMIKPKIPDVKEVKAQKPSGETKNRIRGGRKTRKRKHKRKSKKRKAKKKSRVKRKRKSRKKRVGGHDHGLHLGGGKFLLGGGI